MKDKHVLITGHTGFKGSWLLAMLHHQGAKVSGVALDPVKSGIFEKTSLHDLLVHDIRLDIRDSTGLKRAVSTISPDVVIHLAAQPLVLASYAQPAETYDINVTGTLNLLQAVEESNSVEVTLIVTTDKVYRQEHGLKKAFVESDALGAADPYSTSKAMADLLTQSWIASHLGAKIAIARAGNVIGGGDVAENRLLPDLIKAFESGKKAVVRSPQSVRPWQHVLDCLNGYLLLAGAIQTDQSTRAAFNFSPSRESSRTVSEIANFAAEKWGSTASWTPRSGEEILGIESDYLALNSSKAHEILGWKNILDTQEAVEWTIKWHRDTTLGKSALETTLSQVNDFYRLLDSRN